MLSISHWQIVNLNSHYLLLKHKKTCSGGISEIYFGQQLILYFHKRYFCACFMKRWLVFVNMANLDLVGAKRSLYFNHIILNFWTKECFYAVFVFKKQNHMLFIKSLF